MNGIFNIVVALLLGSAVVWTGYALSKDGNANTTSDTRIEELAQRTLNEAKARFEEDCRAVDDCEKQESLGIVSPEAPYSSDVAAMRPVGTGTLGSDSLIDNDEMDYGPIESRSSVASRNTLRSEAPSTAKTDNAAEEKPIRLAALDVTGNGYNSPTAGINTTNRRIGVDKEDSGRYFSEGRRLDKPDSQDYFTEGERLPENRYSVYQNPCLREDGSLYTGPGTAKNPFAESNPCLVAETPPQLAQSDSGITMPAEQPIENLPAVEYYPVPPAQPVELANRCEYRSGGYTADPINDGRGEGWLANFGCFSALPPGGFGPQPTLGGGGSDYAP